ncbi:cobalamin-dependent protein, partial [Candidatus Woesearchaeota archaeon]|nr:cobalamin-dependent protein [Candidatus Woesearchaeota archaeon]
MVKGVLINYGGYPNTPSALMPDNGLANLAGSLIREGHEAIILDYNTVDSIRRLFPQNREGNLDERIKQAQKQDVADVANNISNLIEKENIAFIGFKLVMGTGFESSIEIAEKVKEDNPEIPIFAGGPHIDWFRERICEVTDVFVALAYGEGEETIVRLAEYVERKRELNEIPNLIYKENGDIKITPIKRIDDLNSLAFPIYDEDVYLAMKGDNKIKIIVIDESRGCPNRCNFCIHPIKSGNKRRIKDPSKLVSEI